jgi:hypothetical protein
MNDLDSYGENNRSKSAVHHYISSAIQKNTIYLDEMLIIIILPLSSRLIYEKITGIGITFFKSIFPSLPWGGGILLKKTA